MNGSSDSISTFLVWQNCRGRGGRMSFTDYLTLILGSSAVGAIVTYFSTQHTNIRSHKVKYITEERQKWRHDIKQSVAEFCSSVDQEKRSKLKTFIILSLNPCDDKDKKIADCLYALLEDRNDEKLRELEKRVAFLLKHDWERVKDEVGIDSKNVDRENQKCKDMH